MQDAIFAVLKQISRKFVDRLGDVESSESKEGECNCASRDRKMLFAIKGAVGYVF